MLLRTLNRRLFNCRIYRADLFMIFSLWLITFMHLYFNPSGKIFSAKKSFFSNDDEWNLDGRHTDACVKFVVILLKFFFSARYNFYFLAKQTYN